MAHLLVGKVLRIDPPNTLALCRGQPAILKIYNDDKLKSLVFKIRHTVWGHLTFHPMQGIIDANSSIEIRGEWVQDSDAISDEEHHMTVVFDQLPGEFQVVFF